MAETQAQSVSITRIEHETMRTFLVPVTMKIFSDLSGRDSSAVDRKQLLEKILDRHGLDADFQQFDANYLTAGLSTTENFRKHLRTSLIEKYNRKKELAGGSIALNAMYIPDNSNVYSGENMQRVISFGMDLAQGVETEILREQMAGGEIKGATGTDLENGQLRLFIDPLNPSRVIALNEDQAKSEQYKDYIPYVAFGLRKDAISGRSVSLFGPGAGKSEESATLPEERERQIRQHFGDSRAAAATRLLENRGLQVISPLTVSEDGRITGEIRAVGANGEPVKVKVDISNNPFEANPEDRGELIFNFTIEEGNDVGKEFSLLSDELPMFNEHGELRDVHDVSEDALNHSRISKLAAGRPMPQPVELGAGLGRGLPAIKTKKEELPGVKPAPVQQMEDLNRTANLAKLASISLGATAFEPEGYRLRFELTTPMASKKALAAKGGSKGLQMPRPPGISGETAVAGAGEETASAQDKKWPSWKKWATAGAVGTGSAFAGVAAATAMYVSNNEPVKKVGVVILHCLSKICLS